MDPPAAVTVAVHCGTANNTESRPQPACQWHWQCHWHWQLASATGTGSEPECQWSFELDNCIFCCCRNVRFKSKIKLKCHGGRKTTVRAHVTSHKPELAATLGVRL